MRPVLGVANRITFARAVLAVLVMVLVAADANVPAIVSIASAALVLDYVDGWVARRTNTVTEFGARFDMEVDAFLILVLSVAAARDFGGWTLAIGLARYAYGLVALVVPLLRGATPPSRWRKFVAAVQGVSLTVAVSRVLPDLASRYVLVIALAMLAQSFGTQVGWLWDHRAPRPRVAPSTVRRLADVGFSLLSLVLVWAVLLAPDNLDQLKLTAFLRIPVEGLVLVGLALALPARPRRVLAISVGMVLAALLVLKVLDMGYRDILDRPFNPITDRGTFGPAIGVLSDAIGHRWAIVVVTIAALAGLAVLVLIPFCVLRITRLAITHRATTMRTVAVLAVVWAIAASFGLRVDHGEPVASAGAAGLAFDHIRAAGAAVADEQNFAKSLRSGHDTRALIPADQLLAKLRGKDVLVVFIESYGQVAVQDSSFAAEDDAFLREQTQQLTAAGYESQSAFLTSPTFGGISWLAHSTLQSGLWIDNQGRYDDLVNSRRFTLSDAFKKAGWRTVSDVPSDLGFWKQGASFYHYDAQYNASNTGYDGPILGYARIPDQYSLAQFESMELQRANRKPVFAELDLDSSHTPWTPLPRLVPWSSIGNGELYNAQVKGQPGAAQLWQDASRVQANYATSIRYSIGSLVSYLRAFHDPHLVVVALGDHEPSKTVSGENPTHNVPISIITPDPAVLQGIASWRWQQGLLPDPSAPVWKMDAFRDRFLDAYSS